MAMSSASPSPCTLLVMDPLSCPSCGEGYTCSGTEGVPVTLSCGHTVCEGCVNALQVLDSMYCTICRGNVERVTVRNPDLAAFCDAMRVTVDAASVLSECASPCGGNPTEAQISGAQMGFTSNKRAKIDESAEGVPGPRGGGPLCPDLLCPVHPDQLLSLLCLKDERLACTKCMLSHHRGRGHRAVKLSAASIPTRLVDVLQGKREVLQRKKRECETVAEHTAAKRAQVEAQASAQCNDVTRACEAIKRSVDEYRAATMADITARCRQQLKQLDAQCDAAIANANQLALALSVCDSGLRTALADDAAGTTLAHKLHTLQHIATPPVLEVAEVAVAQTKVQADFNVTSEGLLIALTQVRCACS